MYLNAAIAKPARSWPLSACSRSVMTSLAMILAEELEYDFAKVKVEYASANRNYLDGGPYGQMGTVGLHRSAAHA